MKTFFAAMMLMLGVAAPVSAQDAESENPVAPYWFVGAQGGVQNTLNKHFDNKKTFTPTAALSVGRFFSPEVGARLNFNGIWNKGTASSVLSNEEAHWKYSYLTTSADLLVNLCTTFGNKDYYPVNLYLIGGLGLYHAWDADEAADLAAQVYRLSNTDVEKRNAFNGRLGLQLEANLCRNLALNIEGTYNMHAGQPATFAKDNDQFVLLAGLNYKFGYKKPAAAQEEEWVTVTDTIWYNEDTFAPRIEGGTMTWNVFYEIRESEFNDPDAYLAKIGAFLKEHRECKVTIKSYADVQTGNPKINMEYSKQRSEKAVKALVEAGVSESAITATYYGDTVQPFADNDKNRVSIITATGLKDVKDRYTVKKFRTEENRVLLK